MIAASIRRWAAWAPDLEDRSAWQSWAGAPQPLGVEGSPAASFLPAMLRRRCSPLARMMLTAAFECCDEEELPEVATVFASRHGNINESVGMFGRLARRQALSPTKFSHTVHNAQAGLFSIAAENRQASSSLSAGEESFECGYLEALTFLERKPKRPVLLVVADAPLCDAFAPLVQEAPGAYALALLLETAPEGSGVTLALEPGIGTHTSPQWPGAMEFLRWHLAGSERLVMGSGPRRWVWERAQ
jgi:hypothetical protein